MMKLRKPELHVSGRETRKKEEMQNYYCSPKPKSRNPLAPEVTMSMWSPTPKYWQSPLWCFRDTSRDSQGPDTPSSVASCIILDYRKGLEVGVSSLYLSTANTHLYIAVLVRVQAVSSTGVYWYTSFHASTTSPMKCLISVERGEKDLNLEIC